MGTRNLCRCKLRHYLCRCELRCCYCCKCELRCYLCGCELRCCYRCRCELRSYLCRCELRCCYSCKCELRCYLCRTGPECSRSFQQHLQAFYSALWVFLCVNCFSILPGTFTTIGSSYLESWRSCKCHSKQRVNRKCCNRNFLQRFQHVTSVELWKSHCLLTCLGSILVVTAFFSSCRCRLLKIH